MEHRLKFFNFRYWMWKGFMIYDFLKLIPNINKIIGIDISEYAIKIQKRSIKNLK